MIRLMFPAIFLEMAMIVLLLFRNPLRKLVLVSLGHLKLGRGPVIVTTIAATMAVVLISRVHSMEKIQERLNDDNPSDPTDQLLMSKYLLEASLIGSSMFLVLMIDRLHHWMRKLRLTRENIEAIKKQNQTMEDDNSNCLKRIKSLVKEIAILQSKLQQCNFVFKTRAKMLIAAKANTIALRKQCGGYQLQIDRLVEEKQILRAQLKVLDRRLSRTQTKKNL